MYNKTTLLFLAFLLFVSQTFCQWKSANPAGTTINDLFFVNKYVGYAGYTASGIGNCTTNMGLYKTVDQGKHWIRLNTGFNGTINALHFISETVGWFCGSSSVIYKTIDGGNSWVLQNSGIGDGYSDIFFTNASNGFTIGASGYLRRSNNGGTTWQTIGSGVTTNLRKIKFFDTNNGIIACGNGQLLKTNNGGTSWSVVTTGLNVANDIEYFGSANNIIAVGPYSIAKSTDAGLTWSIIPLNTSTPLLRAFFINGNKGYICSDANGIFKTVDAGETWTESTTLNGTSDTWNALYFTDENNGYCAGYTGSIIKTSDGGLTWKSQARIFGVGGELNSVYATHRDTAYTVSMSGKIFKTDNAGLHWQQLYANNGALSKILFVNSNVGYAVGTNNSILKTTDKGATWNIIPNTANTIYDLTKVNNDTILFCGDNGKIYRTKNGGISFDTINTNINEGLRAITCLNYDTIFAVTVNKILSSYNGGLSWNIFTTPLASSFNDIVFINNQLGYCAGSFGKMLFTTNTGLVWNATDSSQTNNINITEIWPVNDKKMFAAKSTSQYLSLDSCVNFFSQSTACLANNWSMNSICMTDSGRFGYCVGGLQGLVHILEERSIPRTIVPTNAYCAGSNIDVAFLVKGFYNNPNTFAIELSDAQGSFANPTTIGTFTAPLLVYQSGVVNCSLPSTISGTQFRIRTVSQNPVVIGNDNGFDIEISTNISEPTVSIVSNVNNLTCQGSTVILNAQVSNSGMSPSYQWFVNGNATQNYSQNFVSNTLNNNDSVWVVVNSSLQCLSQIAAASQKFYASIGSLAYNKSNDTLICNSDTIMLKVLSNGTTFNWSNQFNNLDNALSSTIMAYPSNSSWYNFNISYGNNCVVSDSILVEVVPQLGIPNIYLSNNILYTDSTAFQYQWYLNNVAIDSAINNWYQPTTNGLYTISITDSLNCSINTNSITVLTTELKSITNNVLSIVPNPANGMVRVRLDDEVKNDLYTIELFSSKGDKINVQFEKMKNETFEFDAQNLSNGIYFLRIVSISKTTNTKFIKIP
jgi:photosystem II stability/assembly factor-like uncharacterized protein